eukprot:GHVS01064639.1.p1 GENE.GHVS01064639.1~~GHVS01064639.1.p1  ORF type:complete len:428 (+),score=71.11 GHVS01064639.1:54-1286(+)
MPSPPPPSSFSPSEVNGRSSSFFSSLSYIPAVAVDCEMVGCGPNGEINGLGRISIIDVDGGIIMDEFVKPMEPITDYRSHITGLYPHHLAQAMPYLLIREKAVSILKDRIVVGHAVHNDFAVLCFHPPQELVRDTSFYKPLRYAKANSLAFAAYAGSSGRHPSRTAVINRFGSSRQNNRGGGATSGCLLTGITPGLRKLVKHWFNEDVQGGAHDSVEDARMAMRLYLLVRQDWEARHSPVLCPHYAKWGVKPPVTSPLNMPLHMHSQWMATAKSKPNNVAVVALPPPSAPGNEVEGGEKEDQGERVQVVEMVLRVAAKPEAPRWYAEENIEEKRRKRAERKPLTKTTPKGTSQRRRKSDCNDEEGRRRAVARPSKEVGEGELQANVRMAKRLIAGNQAVSRTNGRGLSRR